MCSQNDDDSKREHSRLHTTIKIEYGLIIDSFIDYSKNFSKGGIFINTSRPYPIGSKLQLRFSVPGRKKSLQLIGEVVHIVWSGKNNDEESTEPGMGVKFTNLSKADKGAINKLLNKE